MDDIELSTMVSWEQMLHRLGPEHTVLYYDLQKHKDYSGLNTTEASHRQLSVEVERLFKGGRE